MQTIARLRESGVRRHTRMLLSAMALVCAAVTLGACGERVSGADIAAGETEDGQTSEERPLDLARYIVSAIATDSLGDASSLFGRTIDADEMRQLQTVVSSRYGGDPQLYQAERLDQGEQEAGADLTVRVTGENESGSVAYLVRLRWDATKPREIWADGEYVETVLGDWYVLGITAEDLPE